MNSDLLTTTEAAALRRVSVHRFLRWARKVNLPRLGARCCLWRRSDIERAIEDALVFPGKPGRNARVRIQRSRSGDAGDRIQKLLNQVRATSPS